MKYIPWKVDGKSSNILSVSSCRIVLPVSLWTIIFQWNIACQMFKPLRRDLPSPKRGYIPCTMVYRIAYMDISENN